MCVCVCLIQYLCCSSQEDLSMPIVEEDIDGLSGLLFPFYDADTHMLYLAGKVSAQWIFSPLASLIISVMWLLVAVQCLWVNVVMAIVSQRCQIQSLNCTGVQLRSKWRKRHCLPPTHTHTHKSYGSHLWVRKLTSNKRLWIHVISSKCPLNPDWEPDVMVPPRGREAFLLNLQENESITYYIIPFTGRQTD